MNSVALPRQPQRRVHVRDCPHSQGETLRTQESGLSAVLNAHVRPLEQCMQSCDVVERLQMQVRTLASPLPAEVFGPPSELSSPAGCCGVVHKVGVGRVQPFSRDQRQRNR